MKQVVKKKILWNTIKLHGTQFRITLAYKIWCLYITFIL
jgi:hypothetical protein